jgi:Tfp pilus assembly PilM family ATPase
MFSATSIGIEISGKDLRIAVLRSVMGRLRFVRLSEVAGFGDMPPEEQKASVTRLVREHQLPAGRVSLSLPRDGGIVRQIDFPVEVREKLRSAVTLQLETLCPWPVDEIYWDFAEEPARKGAKTVTVTVVMIPRATLDTSKHRSCRAIV